MEKPWRKNLINIEPYVAGEQPKDDKIIKLNANENPFPPSPEVQKILEGQDSADFRKYPISDAMPLREALAEREGLKPENVFCANGSDDVLCTAFRAYFNSDKPIIYPDITYSFYPVWCRLLKIPFETKPVDKNFRIDINDYKCENGGVVIANPNAPTSLCEGEKFIRELVESNQNSIVIVDEAYVDFGGFSSVKLIKEYDNLVVTQTFSKSRSLAGLRVGMAYASEELISYLMAAKDSYNSYPLDSVAIKCACASVRDEKYFNYALQRIMQIRDKTADELRKMNFEVLDSSTNFLFARHKTVPAKDIFMYLREKGVFVRYFDKPRINEYLRITVGTQKDMEVLLAALRQM